MEDYEIQHDCDDEDSPIFGISDTDYGAKNYAKFYYPEFMDDKVELPKNPKFELGT